MDINENEMIEIQTQLRLVNNAYFKFNQQRAIVQNLEEEFQNYFNGIVESKGGDSEKQWQLDLENKKIVEAPEGEGKPVANSNNNSSAPNAPQPDIANVGVSKAVNV
tara:strand:- start:653 stop:973 length:321 start_codon:yes stop_codon:yes gene_type:complete